MLAAPLFWGGWFLWARPAVDPFWPLATPLTFALPALVYPVLEEIAFRGALQGALWRTPLAHWQLGPLSGPNLAAGLAFAGLHVAVTGHVLAASVLAPGLVFGYFRDRDGSLTRPIFLHAFYNTGFVWLFANPA